MPRSSHANPNQADPKTLLETEGISAVGSFLRNLAARVEADATLAREIQIALVESGLISSAEWARRSRIAKAKQLKPKDTAAGAVGTPATVLDPFRVLLDHGEKGLQDSLESLDLTELRAIVRRHRLDPARISARWKERERVIQLIVSQVKAYAGYGKAFSHV